MKATTMMNTALKAAGHYIDFANNIVYVTTQFNKKAEKYGTVECGKLNEIMKMFPTFSIKVHAQKRQSAAISYDMMELFIRNMPDAAVNIAEFNRMKQMSKAYKSAYKFVNDWFEKKFPYYGELVKKDEKGNVVWDAVSLYRNAAEEAVKGVSKDAEKAEHMENTPATITELSTAV